MDEERIKESEQHLKKVHFEFNSHVRNIGSGIKTVLILTLGTLQCELDQVKAVLRCPPSR